MLLLLLQDVLWPASFSDLSSVLSFQLPSPTPSPAHRHTWPQTRGKGISLETGRKLCAVKTGFKFPLTAQGKQPFQPWKAALSTPHILKAAPGDPRFLRMSLPGLRHETNTFRLWGVGGRGRARNTGLGQPVLTRCPSSNPGIQLITSSCDSLVNV